MSERETPLERAVRLYNSAQATAELSALRAELEEARRVITESHNNQQCEVENNNNQPTVGEVFEYFCTTKLCNAITCSGCPIMDMKIK